MSDASRISERFAALRASGRRALIPYVTAGYPAPESTGFLLEALADAGADIIELGVPFSDPVADGPTIQRSSFASLGLGTDVGGVIETVRDFRARRDVPIVLFSYLNPVLGYGADRFIEHAADAGASGVLLTDLPAGADPDLEAAFMRSELDFIRLIAPTTPPDRVRDIVRQAQGFIYYVGTMGVTGARAEVRAETLREVAALRRQSTVPVAVGFGISTPAHAAEVAAVADGVIVGSALIDALDAGGIDGAAGLLAAMRAAMEPKPAAAAGG